MNTKLYEQFEDSVTQFKNKIQTDGFFVVRLQIMFWYLLIGFAIFIAFGWLLGSVTLRTVHDIAVMQSGQSVEDAFAWYHKQLIIRRYIMSALFVVSSYFFAEFALLPVRRTRDIQKRFVATVSHELRTPLTIIKNSSEIALRNSKDLSNEKAVELIKSNLEEVNRMTDTIQFLLAYSLLREQKKIPELVLISLTELIENTWPLLQKVGSEHDVVLKLSAEKTALIKGNRVALEGMLINLVKNAIAHSPKGGTVSVCIKETGSRVQLLVTDTGSGIQKKDLPYIYEPFFRGKNEKKSEQTHNGFGLGLSIVKEVVEYHKALLRVETSSKGTKFVITFLK